MNPNRTFAVVADDDPDTAETLAMLVGGWGNHVLEIVHDGRSAVTQALLNVDRLQLVLIDMEMPGTSGINAGMQIRAACGVEPVIVALSGNDHCLADARVCGSFDHCFSKPVDAHALRRAIDTSLAGRNASH